MGLFRGAARAYLLNRLLRNNRRRSRFGGYGSAYPRRRRRSGFGLHGPFPSYSRRTRRGSRVTVTGCCLPIPLALTLGTAAVLGRALARQ